MLAPRNLGLLAISTPTQYLSRDVNAGVLPCCVDTLASAAAGGMCDPYCLGSQAATGAALALPAASPFSFLTSSFAIGSFQIPFWLIGLAGGLFFFGGHR
jgi:hypothetical protein